MAGIKPKYTKMKLETLVDKSGNFKDGGKRVNNFLDHFYDQKKLQGKVLVWFLTK